MDVILLKDDNNTFHCTPFYIKYSKVAVDTINDALGGPLNDIQDDDEEYELNNKPFPVSTNKEIYQNAVNSHNNSLRITENNSVEIYCNNQSCDTVKAVVFGPNSLVHFWDEKTKEYYTTPPSDYLTQYFPQLQRGANRIRCIHKKTQELKEFSIWWYDIHTRFVIMDIDGTITKSDIRGYITTVYLGMYSYVHEGIVDFLTKLHNNYGYEILYLTARPHAHLKMTVSFLQNLRNEKQVTIPQGPIIANKDRIKTALYRELFKKDMNKMKASVLAEIAELFQRVYQINGHIRSMQQQMSGLEHNGLVGQGREEEENDEENEDEEVEEEAHPIQDFLDPLTNHTLQPPEQPRAISQEEKTHKNTFKHQVQNRVEEQEAHLDQEEELMLLQHLFVLGVGNKEQDAIAYSAARIPASRILLIDTQSYIIPYHCFPAKQTLLRSYLLHSKQPPPPPITKDTKTKTVPTATVTTTGTVLPTSTTTMSSGTAGLTPPTPTNRRRFFFRSNKLPTQTPSPDTPPVTTTATDTVATSSTTTTTSEPLHTPTKQQQQKKQLKKKKEKKGYPSDLHPLQPSDDDEDDTDEAETDEVVAVEEEEEVEVEVEAERMQELVERMTVALPLTSSSSSSSSSASDPTTIGNNNKRRSLSHDCAVGFRVDPTTTTTISTSSPSLLFPPSMHSVGEQQEEVEDVEGVVSDNKQEEGEEVDRSIPDCIFATYADPRLLHYIDHTNRWVSTN